MLCGDISQVPTEIQTGSILIQYLLTLPIIGWTGFQIRNAYKDTKAWLRRRKEKRSTSENKAQKVISPQATDRSLE
jgi:hypothetical protein